jgi:hypothetical protein
LRGIIDRGVTVIAVVGHLMRHDQMMLRLYSTLHVVADNARLLARGGHCAAVWIGERYLRLAGGVHALLDSSKRTSFFPVMGELLDRPCHPRLNRMHAGLAHHFVRAIKFGHIPLYRRIDLAQAPAQLLAREALRLRVDGFELAAVDGHNAGIQKIDASAESDELCTHLADGGAVVATEICDRLEVRRETAGQPDEFQVPMALAFEPT